ncbi:MAG: hypothetical protein ABIU86_02595 [Gemmatimonadaceae bacterium]
MTADLSKLLRAQNFNSAAEADAFVQRLLNETGGELPPPAVEETPLEQAQDLMYTAWDLDDPEERVTIAELALGRSADCADALSLLGDEKAASHVEARVYFEAAVHAGRRALGEKAFEEDVGHFWGIMETRPYMRARLHLAHTEWALGNRDAAIGHLQDMLRLNPGDNQGIRFALLGMSVEARDRDAVENILDAYPDEDNCDWLYDKALWLIARGASQQEVALAIDDAIEENPFAPQFILGRKALPREAPQYVEWRSEGEAGAYAMEARRRWVSTIDALEHLRRGLARRRKSRGKDSR